MIHAANTVTYNMANDDESYNKEMGSGMSVQYILMTQPFWAFK
jgi:hypothetical protein